MKAGLSDRDRAAQALTGGLVAAFSDSISAWVIHTLLVDCSEREKSECEMARLPEVLSQTL